MNEAKGSFFEASKKFHTATQKAVIISESRLGIIHTGRQNRVLMTFAKTVTHAMSIQLIYGHAIKIPTEVGLLDHFSVATLTRSLIDTAIMTLYLSEPSLSLAAWDLRRHVLFLHDLTNRRRFLTTMSKLTQKSAPPSDKDAYYRAKNRILEVIKNRGNALLLPATRIEDLCKGQIVFIDGLRGAVREAGLDVDHYEFFQVYLSNHVHGHPGSYLRVDEQEISFESPSDFQFGFCGLCLDAGAQYLEAITERVEIFTGNSTSDPNGHLD